MSKETRTVPLALPRKSAKRDLKELPCSGQGGAGGSQRLLQAGAGLLAVHAIWLSSSRVTTPIPLIF